MTTTLSTMARIAVVTAAIAIGISAAGPDAGTASIPSFLDTNGDGQIDTEERLAFMEARSDARKGLVRMWDTNRDGIIDSDEQAQASDALRVKVQNKRTELFHGIAGPDGILSIDEFATIPVLQQFPPDYVEALYRFLDSDANGDVSLTEFLAPLD